MTSGPRPWRVIYAYKAEIGPTSRRVFRFRSRSSARLFVTAIRSTPYLGDVTVSSPEFAPLAPRRRR